MVTLLIFSDCCRVRKIPPPPFPPILRLYSPSLNTFPGLLLELGSSISKVSGNTFSNSEAFLKSCRLAGVVVAELLLSFVFEIRRYGRLQPSRCHSSNLSQSSSLSQGFHLLVCQSGFVTDTQILVHCSWHPPNFTKWPSKIFCSPTLSGSRETNRIVNNHVSLYLTFSYNCLTCKFQLWLGFGVPQNWPQ